MQVWTQRIVFGAEIYSFGLGEKEIREVLNKVVERECDWDVNDIRNGRNGQIEILLEYNEKGRFYISGTTFDELKKVAERLFEQIEEELKRYANIKPYLTIYNNCNGHNGNGRKGEDTKDILRKVGIPVIS